MQDLAPPRATYADVLAAPERMVAEIINGRLVTMPRPARRQTNAASVLGVLIAGPFQIGLGGPGGWWVQDEPELHLDEEVMVPDLAGWRRERMPELGTGAYFDLAPDWVCEVLSPSTERHDRTEKRDLYARFGVPHLWLVDPVRQLLEAFRLSSGKWLLEQTLRDDDNVDVEPFAAVPFKLGALWADGPAIGGP